MRKYLCLIILLLEAPLNLSVKAQSSIHHITNPKDYGTGYVSNADGIISGKTLASINAILTKLDKEKKAQVAVVLVNSISDAVAKDFAVKLFRDWKIGDRRTNNGLLILLIKDQKRIEFEVGYGLEGILPDIISNRIQQETMIPKLKKGYFDSAVLSGVEAVAARLSASEEELGKNNGILPREKPVYPLIVLLIDFLVFAGYILIYAIYVCSPVGERVLHKTSCWWGIFLLTGPVVIVTLLAAFTNVYLTYDVIIMIIYSCCCICMNVYFTGEIIFLIKDDDLTRNKTYDKLKFKMRDLIFYTFLFPLPLLIIQLIRIKIKLYRLRYAPYYSEKCKENMSLVRIDKFTYLSAAERVEDKLGAATYDIWKAAHCDDLLKIKYVNQASRIVKCNICGSMAGKVVSSKTEIKATSVKEGLRVRGYKCQFCKANFNKREPVRRKDINFAIGSGSGGSYGSGRSSGSSGSWGGGSSGGGGSGSNW